MPPGRSRGISGCVRAPCVFLAAAEGMARGCAGVLRGNPVLLPKTGGRARVRHPRRRRGRHRSRKPASGAMSLFAATQISWLPLQTQTRCRTHAAAMLAFARRWALALRPEHHPRSDPSGHVEQPACRTRAVRRNRTRSAAGTFSGHRQRSRRTCHQRCGWPTLSDDERAARRGARAIARRTTR